MKERNLWDRTRMGDKEAFLSLYELHYSHLFTFGCTIYPDKELVKDCIHDVFCEIWDKRNQLKDVSNTKSYLFTYLKRKVLKSIAPLSNTDRITDTPENNLSYYRSYEEILVKMQGDEEMKLKLNRVLEKLTPTQLEVIRMRFFDGLNYSEIATILQLQPRTVYNMVYEGLKILRKYMAFTAILSLILSFLRTL